MASLYCEVLWDANKVVNRLQREMERTQFCLIPLNMLFGTYSRIICCTDLSLLIDISELGDAITSRLYTTQNSVRVHVEGRAPCRTGKQFRVTRLRLASYRSLYFLNCLLLLSLSLSPLFSSLPLFFLRCVRVPDECPLKYVRRFRLSALRLLTCTCEHIRELSRFS